MVKKLIQGALFCALLIQGNNSFAFSSRNQLPAVEQSSVKSSMIEMKNSMIEMRAKMNEMMKNKDQWMNMSDSEMLKMEKDKSDISLKFMKNLMILAPNKDFAPVMKQLDEHWENMLKTSSNDLDALDKSLDAMPKGKNSNEIAALKASTAKMKAMMTAMKEKDEAEWMKMSPDDMKKMEDDKIATSVEFMKAFRALKDNVNFKPILEDFQKRCEAMMKTATKESEDIEKSLNELIAKK